VTVRQTGCRCRQLVYDYARFAQTCQDHASGHDRCVRPQIPGLSPGGLGPHIMASGSPAGFPPVSRLPAGFFPFARLPLVSRRPAFSGSSPSAVARVPVPLQFPSGFPSASNAHASAAARRFRRRWSRAAGTKVTSSAAAPCLDRAIGPHYIYVQHLTASRAAASPVPGRSSRSLTIR